MILICGNCFDQFELYSNQEDHHVIINKDSTTIFCKKVLK